MSYEGVTRWHLAIVMKKLAHSVMLAEENRDWYFI